MLKFHRLNFLLLFIFLIQPFLFHAEALAEGQKVFRTKFAEIYYSEDASLVDFFWRISGKRLNFTEESNLAESRVDSIIDRVQSVLDMHPDNFRIKINLYSQYKEGRIAFYSNKEGSITVYADRVTDGILAHEIAHAIICKYFLEPPPEKIQEILSQYVDKHLWSDY